MTIVICVGELPCDIVEVENVDKCINIDRNAIDIKSVDIVADDGLATAATVTVMTAAMTTFGLEVRELNEMEGVQGEVVGDQNVANHFLLP